MVSHNDELILLHIIQNDFINRFWFYLPRNPINFLSNFKEKISTWNKFRSVRSAIEEMFKLAKKEHSMEDFIDIRGVLP